MWPYHRRLSVLLRLKKSKHEDGPEKTCRKGGRKLENTIEKVFRKTNINMKKGRRVPK
jgi:hypothetical protein